MLSAQTLLRPAAAAAAPLRGLAGSDLSRRFRHWRGASGRQHLFSVFPLDGEAPRFAEAVVLAVGRDAAGVSRILAMGETGSSPERLLAGRHFRDAAAAGADEVHVHLLAEGPDGRAAVLRDLRAA